MIKIFSFIFLLLSLFNASCQQRADNYVEHLRSLDQGFYSITFYYSSDTSYNMLKTLTSLYQDTSLISTHFLHHNMMNGPVEHYRKGELLSKGFMKDNKRHGEFLYYEGHDKVDRLLFYNMDVKVGVRKYYYTTGILFKKVHYNNGSL